MFAECLVFGRPPIRAEKRHSPEVADLPDTSNRPAHAIQNSLQLHPGFFSRNGCACQLNQIQDWSQDALPYSSSPRVVSKAFKPLKKRKSSRTRGKCGKVVRLYRATFPSGGGNLRFCGFPRTPHFPSGHSGTADYPQIPLKTRFSVRQQRARCN